MRWSRLPAPATVPIDGGFSHDDDVAGSSGTDFVGCAPPRDPRCRQDLSGRACRRRRLARRQARRDPRADRRERRRQVDADASCRRRLPARQRRRSRLDGVSIGRARRAWRGGCRHRHGLPGAQPGRRPERRRERLCRPPTRQPRSASSAASRCTRAPARFSPSSKSTSIPRTLVAELSPGQQQMVEIAKGLSHELKVIILDEPTSSLTIKEGRHALPT